MSRLLIAIGVLLIVLGLLWPLFARMGLGRLPGDIVIERENLRIHFPIVTALVISVAATVALNLILWFLNR
ncbi:DUF2905 domain-containing protein [Oceanicella actignis]|uniref:DUF2905 domain-containing protein n=1 Tax=Oceanicella actignis TaxID=1189325 RepID=A0A1M7TBJ8_9RHOB|nr:DUF2905 domain-containing protein [Oceanicella actignis]SET53909.1 Protein of unknown function [Oceanicella actignis]SHN68139.1 Protein of unknown function [Oceanicella actignis]